MSTNDFKSLLSGKDSSPMEEDYEYSPSEERDDIEASYSIDSELLIHRDSHFGGSFSLMIDYYEQEGIGACEDFSLGRIKELAKYEEELGHNLAGELLTGSEAEIVGRSREMYRKLRDLYEKEDDRNSIPCLIADLILAEEDASSEIEAIISQGKKMIPELLLLVKGEDFYSPFFPGYGFAPERAMSCLGMLGDETVVPALFERVQMEDPFEDEAPLQALQLLKKFAKPFLLKVLSARPLTRDNDRAAYILADRFSDNASVAWEAYQLLQEEDVARRRSCSSDLIISCQSLDPEHREDCLRYLKTLPEECFSYSSPEDLANQWKI